MGAAFSANKFGTHGICGKQEWNLKNGGQGIANAEDILSSGVARRMTTTCA